MSTQIFKNPVSKDILFNFLEKCSIKKEKCYVFSKTSFKKAQYLNIIQPFCSELNNYYYNSKKKYLNRKMSYKNFNTILRQLCKNMHIPYSSEIKYDKSTYEIYYTIFTSFD
tara:strand:- start:139 stop:474 length:336 start_codon:yes stop_codon:yes gene_type:complete